MTEPDSSFNLALGRLLIAAAWSDGELTADERASLEDLIFRLPGLTVREWEALREDLGRPVDERERGRRLEQLHSLLRGPRERELVAAAIEELTGSDAVLSEEDQRALQEALAGIGSKDAGAVPRLRRFLAEPMARRARAIANFFHREQEFEEDVRGRIHRAVSLRFHLDENTPELTSEEFHKLCLAGGIMARVANVDEVITQGEFSTISAALQEGWGLDLPWAAMVAEIAISEVTAGLDTHALVREFFRCTTEAERIAFLDVLFLVALGDDRVSREEIEEIRRISRGFLLSHRHFIAAKLKVPSSRRDA